MSSSVPAQRLALVNLMRQLFPEDAVSYGRPVTLSSRMAHLGDARVSNAQPSSGGGVTRTRREEVEVEVVLSAYVPGNPDANDDAQQNATEWAYEMLDQLETYFRTVASGPLIPKAFPSIVSSHEMTIAPAYDSNDVIVGWMCDITATVTTTATV